MYQYPYQIHSAFSKSRDGRTLTTLGLEAHFSLESGSYNGSEQEEINPLEMHEGYSHFIATLIQKTGNEKRFVYANIPAVCDADEIVINTQAAASFVMAEKLKGSSAPAEQKTLPKAYAVPLTMGTHKGKTPADILLADPNARADLLKTHDFLAKNADKYPSNRQQMEAIDSAIRLLDAGQLNAGTAKASGASDKCISIYSADFKPLRSTLADGRVTVYSININCYPSHRYPYQTFISGFGLWKYKVISLSLQDGKPVIVFDSNIEDKSVNTTPIDIEDIQSITKDYCWGYPVKQPLPQYVTRISIEYNMFIIF